VPAAAILEALSSFDTSVPCNHERASRGKTRTRLAEGGHGNGPLDSQLCGSETQDLIQAGPLGIQ